MNDLLQQKIQSLPEVPGVYQYFNDGQLIYVGKAKNLKKRVSSYFSKDITDKKTKRLVAQIEDIKFIVVNTEQDALLLENNLIKQYQPKYNILLRDDKTYPYICITKEPFPRVFSVRRQIDTQKARYFGPYPQVRVLNGLLELFKKLYHIRTCSLNINQKTIAEKKFKVCLEYHIGNCKAPCVGYETQSSYNQEVEQIVQILKGNLLPAKQYFKEKMQEHAESYEFEQAQLYKQRLDLLEEYQSKSVITSTTLEDLDVITLRVEEENDLIYANYLKLVEGAVVAAHTFSVKKKIEESLTELFCTLLFEVSTMYQSNAKEVVTNIEIEPDLVFGNKNIVVPQIGDKKKLVELSLKNILFYKKEQITRQSLQDNEDRSVRILKTLQQDLRMKELPIHIECFDNSNIQGTNPVAAMVCFKNAKPSKSDYRHFHIKTVQGPNDFDSMKEVVFRRYIRLLNENQPLPQLIVIDGGKGQLGAACEALKELNLYGKLAIVGIAKRLEEIYVPNDSFPLHIEKKSESLKLLQRIRDETHRFAIKFHRDTRSNNSIQPELLNIKGIGEKLAEKIYKHFKSIQNIEEQALIELIGKSKADLVIKHLKKT
jgi:excinuclease ABC subunit C